MDDTTLTIEPAAVDFAALTKELVSAYVSNNRVQTGDLPALIATIHATLAGLDNARIAAAPAVEKLTSAQIRKSITHDALISFEDGKLYKTLRRHLTIKGLTPEAYRSKWSLPADYPMTAQSYSDQRSALARSLGLGQSRRQHPKAEPAPEPTPVVKAAPQKPRRAARARKTPASV